LRRPAPNSTCCEPFASVRAACCRKTALLDLTQGRNAGSFERSIDVLVSRIRRKNEPDPQDATMIKAVRSGGYMFTPVVDTSTPPANGGS
jgi:two-component system OmpR family response regulator